jgi:hypothetical protein
MTDVVQQAGRILKDLVAVQGAVYANLHALVMIVIIAIIFQFN